MDLVKTSVIDLTFAGGKLVLSVEGGAALVTVDEKLVLDGILKLIPAGSTTATIAGAVFTVIEGASATIV